MKKLFPFLILFILAMFIWDATFDPYHMSFHVDDADFDGPVGTLFGALLACGGLLIGVVVLLVGVVVAAVLSAGVGIVIIAALVLAAIVTALALSPLMLPLLIPIAIIWYLASRDKHRRRDLKERTA